VYDFYEIVLSYYHKSIITSHQTLLFLPREQLCGLGSRNSVRLSLCYTRALWQNQTTHCIYFDITRKANHSSFLTPMLIGGRCRICLKFALKMIHPHSKNVDFDRFPLITSQL